MTIEEYRERLIALKQAAAQKAVEQIIVPAANKLLATIKNRIQVEGKNSSGRQIGTYSQKPMYATKEQFVKTASFKPRGKNEIGSNGKKGKIKKELIGGKRIAVKGKSKTTKVEGIGEVTEFKARKSMYLPDGYKELRSIQGRPSDRVNLTYTGSLMASYQLQAKRGSVLLGLTDEQSAKIREGLEQGPKRRLGYGKVFEATVTELDNYNTEVTNAANNLTKSLLEGKPLSIPRVTKNV